jgi:ATP-dependent Zn protease
MSDITPRRTAWHEAGHAVVAWERGLTVVLVSIRSVGESLGRSTHTPAGNCALPEERQRENIVAMGGWAAELTSGEADDGKTYDSGDINFVVNRIYEHAPERFEIELGWAEREAERIVSENRDRVERLAHALMKRQEIANSDEIRAIIEGRSGEQV